MTPGPNGPDDHDRTDVHCVDKPCLRINVAGLRARIAAFRDGHSGQFGWAEAVLSEARIVDLNEAAVHLVVPYASPGGAVGKVLAEIWPRESRADLADAILAVTAAKPLAAVEVRQVHSLVLDQPTLTVWGHAGDADEVYFSITGGLREERTYYALWTSEARFRRLIHYLPFALLQVDATAMEPIWARLRAEGVTDLPGYLDANPDLVEFSCGAVRVTDANHVAMKLLGLDELAPLLTSVAYIFAASHGTARRVMAAHFLGERTYDEVMKIRTFDGRMRDMRIAVTYPNAPEQRDVTLISLEDLTDRLKTEAQLRQLQADFTHAARISTLGELATSIAHEVNQPLAAVATNADASLRWLAREEPNTDKIRQLTTRIALNARRAGEIIRRVRSMAVKHKPEKLPLSLNRVVEEALLFVRHDIENRSIELVVNLDPTAPRIMGDRVQLQQVFVNLLLNSAQALEHGYGACGPCITVGTRSDEDGNAVFEITDNGPGIAPEDVERIFDGFFTTKEDGMGIGLAICQSILSGHAGRIEASNLSGGGARFEVTIPEAGGPDGA